jgi:tetratricopeptide (TPR) repeat protein
MPTLAEEKSSQAKALFSQKNYEAAASLWSEAIDLADSADPIHTYHSNRCACYLYLNKLGEAYDDAEACTKYSPCWAKGFSRLGNCLVRMRRSAEAVRAFERCLELEPHNEEYKKALENITGNHGRNGNFDSSGFPWASNYGNQIKDTISRTLSQAFYWWSTKSNDKKMMIVASVAFGLYFLYSSLYSFLFRNNYDSYSDYHDNYGSRGGLSWTAWIAIMAAAYKLPPMFPEVFGQYARPFFGMSWTTFMWLLNMITSNSGRYRSRGYGSRRYF